MFQSSVASLGLSPAGRRLLCRACGVFDPLLHLQLVRRAVAWTQACHLAGVDAYDPGGPHGDIRFLLLALRPLLEACRLVEVHRQWLAPVELGGRAQ
jgi:hypothetical protein